MGMSLGAYELNHECSVQYVFKELVLYIATNLGLSPTELL